MHRYHVHEFYDDAGRYHLGPNYDESCYDDVCPRKHVEFPTADELEFDDFDHDDFTPGFDYVDIHPA